MKLITLSGVVNFYQFYFLNKKYTPSALWFSHHKPDIEPVNCLLEVTFFPGSGSR